ncbi:MAG: hydroxymethylbilane synthase [Gammaproteobacteria bacterium]|nr:hydroxymethylbilane synthase [Gammaproteobacteria bacterium]
MSINRIRIATRQSPLAMWQAGYVRDQLCRIHKGLVVDVIGLQTQGDRIVDVPLSTAGGKGLFIKELEQSLLDGNTDIAVHSMKDVTVDLPDGLALSIILKRDDPRDVFISNRYDRLDDLPQGASIGTSSLRRQCQLRAYRSDLLIQDLRGNVGTRIRKLDEGNCDAIILAAAGVRRLGLHNRIREYLGTDRMIPAIGQGAMGIETRADDQQILELVTPLNDEQTRLQVESERAVSRRLYGGCQLPIAANASISGKTMTICGLVGRIDGSMIISHTVTGDVKQGETLGLQLAEKLLARGADVILRDLINA